MRKYKKKITTYEDYDEILFDSISKLDKCSYLCGGEGRVYFLDDDFVIKKIELDDVPDEDMVFGFNAFCEEIQSFGETGLCVPKVYTWHIIQDGEKVDCYILQERVHGRRLFESDIENIYSRCADFCTREEFLSAIKNKEENRELFGKIVYRFIEGFIETNRMLLDVDDEEIRNFIKTDFRLVYKSIYGKPDVHGENIIFDGSKLTLIDNFFDTLPNTHNYERAKITTLKQILLIFYYNELVKEYAGFNCSLKPEFKKMKEENFALCYQAMSRFLKITQQMYNPIVKNYGDFEDVLHFINKPLNRKYASKLSSQVERDLW